MITDDGLLYGIPSTIGEFWANITISDGVGMIDYVNLTLSVGQYVPTDSTDDWMTLAMMLIFFIVLTIINWIGYRKQLPLLQIVAILVMFLAIPFSDTITENFWPLLILFLLVNIVIAGVGLLKMR